jgi:Zn-dependent protease with chaperone function
MLFYITFLLASLLVMGVLVQGFVVLLEMPKMQSFLEANPLVMVLGLTLYIFVVFGFLSRRCERQADLFGCKMVDPQVFIAALEKVALLNGIPREQPGWLSSWQHSTIAKRVDFLMKICANPALEQHFHYHLRLIKWSIVLGLLALLLLANTILGQESFWEIFQQL